MIQNNTANPPQRSSASESHTGSAAGQMPNTSGLNGSDSSIVQPSLNLSSRNNSGHLEHPSASSHFASSPASNANIATGAEGSTMHPAPVASLPNQSYPTPSSSSYPQQHSSLHHSGSIPSGAGYTQPGGIGASFGQGTIPSTHPTASTHSNQSGMPPHQPTGSSSGGSSGLQHIASSDQFSSNNLAKLFFHYFHRVSQMNENSWLSIGRLSLALLDQDRAKIAFEQALKCNPNSIPAIQHFAQFYKQRENFIAAVEYYQKIIASDNQNSDAWSSLAYCYLMQDDVQKAFSAYQQALFYAPNSKDPYLWYGLGILYERHGSDNQAEEFFISALRCDPSFEKSSEIFYRLGIIFKNKKEFDKSIDCFQYILKKPPRPLTESDVKFQIGVLYENQGDTASSREIFNSISTENPRHLRTQQYVAWSEFNTGNFETAIAKINACLELDDSNANSWYIIGRCYVAQRNYTKSCDAYQQAVLRNGKNPVFWCSIGLMYFQIQQYRDALDKFSKAIHLNSQLWEVWWNLGILYETCNNQIPDAIASYKRALEVDPSNALVHQRLTLLSNYQQAPPGTAHLPSIPSPVDLPFNVDTPAPWLIFSKRAHPTTPYTSAGSTPGSYPQSASGPRYFPQSQGQRISAGSGQQQQCQQDSTSISQGMQQRRNTQTQNGYHQSQYIRSSISGTNGIRYSQMQSHNPVSYQHSVPQVSTSGYSAGGNGIPMSHSSNNTSIPTSPTVTLVEEESEKKMARSHSHQSDDSLVKS